MFFQLAGLDDFISMSTAYSSTVRIFYYTNNAFFVYGFIGSSDEVITTILNDSTGAEATLLASFPSAIALDHPLEMSSHVGASDWGDFQTLINGITVSATPPQVVYFVQEGNVHFLAIDPPTDLTFSCIDSSHQVTDAQITAAFPTAVKLNAPIEILEVD